MHAATVSAGLRLENILLATAFSSTSKLALRYGAGLARHFGSKLHVVHVITPQDMSVPAYPVPVPYGSEMQIVEHNMAVLLASTPMKDVVYEAKAAYGQLWPVLADLCDTQKIDMILLGTEGHGGFTKMLFGSAAEEIIRSAPCPVMTIGPHCATNDSHELILRQILCTTDLLPGSHVVSEYAHSLANASGARLTLLHVENSLDRNRVDRTRADLRGQLADPPPHFDQGPGIEHLVELGPTVDVILKAAEVRLADLIVLGTRHTDHPLLTAHVSSTTIHQVLAHAACPVLTLRTDVG